MRVTTLVRSLLGVSHMLDEAADAAKVRRAAHWRHGVRGGDVPFVVLREHRQESEFTAWYRR